MHTIWHYVNCRVRIGHSLSNLRLSCVQPSTSLQNKVAILDLVRQDTTSGHQLVTKWFEETFENTIVQTNVTPETLSNSWHVIIKLILARICTNIGDRTERKWDIWRIYLFDDVFYDFFAWCQFAPIWNIWPYLAYLGAYLSVLNIVKCGISEKILQNVVQTRWPCVKRTSQSVMTKSHFAWRPDFCQCAHIWSDKLRLPYD